MSTLLSLFSFWLLWILQCNCQTCLAEVHRQMVYSFVSIIHLHLCTVYAAFHWKLQILFNIINIIKYGHFHSKTQDTQRTSEAQHSCHSLQLHLTTFKFMNFCHTLFSVLYTCILNVNSLNMHTWIQHTVYSLWSKYTAAILCIGLSCVRALCLRISFHRICVNSVCQALV